MKILFGVPLNSKDEDKFLSSNITYRPDLKLKSDWQVGACAVNSQPQIMVLDRLIEEDVLDNFIARLKNLKKIIILRRDSKLIPKNYKGVNIIEFTIGSKDSIFNLFKYLESKSLTFENGILPKIPISHLRKEITFIGAGIINLYCAFELSKKGYNVQLYDKRPDPNQDLGNSHIAGATFSGKDARIFSFSEARHHFTDSKQGNKDPFRTSISNHGRLCVDSNQLSLDDRNWIEKSEKIPQFLSSIYNKDLTLFNKLSYDLWNNFFNEEIGIVEKYGFTDNLIRVCSSEKKFKNYLSKLEVTGAFVKEISNDELIFKNPCLKDAVENGHIFKSIQEKGFSVNIHQLGLRLIDKIKENGGKINWNSEVSKFSYSSSKKINGIILSNGEKIEVSTVIFSPGAYDNNLLSQLGFKNTVSSMIGMWLELPNINNGLNSPIKLTRTGVGSIGSCKSANIITRKVKGQNLIYVSSGHGFIGKNQIINEKYLEILSKGVIDVSKKYFREHFELVKENLENNLSYCIRPWTPSCLPVFDIKATENGVIITSCGHNTGGFAQAPIISSEILKLIEGEDSLMLKKYHRNRTKKYLE